MSISSTVLVVMLTLIGLANAQERADPQVSSLIAQLNDDGSADRAITRLRALGETVAPALGECVSSGVEPARSRALLVLRQLGSAAVEALPHLVAALESCDPADAPAVYETIADVARIDEIASREIRDRMHVATDRLLQAADQETGMAIRHGFVRALIRMQFGKTGPGALYHLEDNYVIAREYAAEQGGLSGMEQFLPALRKVLEDLDPPKEGGRARAFGERFATSDRVLMKAAWAIERITGEYFDNVHRHRYWLRYGDLPDRVAATVALAQNPGYAQRSLPDLMNTLDDPSPRVAAEAITALGTMGPAATDAIPTLEKLTEHVDPQIAERAKVALRQIRGSALQGSLVVTPKPGA